MPELASRQHLKSIAPVVGESLAQAGSAAADIDAFAVTQGPGLIGSLLVGVSFAKGLAYVFGKPLVGVDHVQAHIEAAFLEHPATPLPALALIVSGGHTSLFLLRERLRLELLGRTRDDAAGEALDKIAKFLDLGYPGGPIIQKLAEPGDPKAFAFVLPRMTDGSLDFSFSGLKTAAIRHVRESGLDKDHPRLPDFLASFEAAVDESLIENLLRAADRVEPKSLILCGGVARNKRLRTRFEETARSHGLAWAVPSPQALHRQRGHGRRPGPDQAPGGGADPLGPRAGRLSAPPGGGKVHPRIRLIDVRPSWASASSRKSV